ncbi:ferredoxin-dependent glutamate synthase, partial [Staphylococcus pseudintermedius]
MTFLTVLQLIINVLLVGIFVIACIALIAFLIFDKRQKQHSVLRNY